MNVYVGHEWIWIDSFDRMKMEWGVRKKSGTFYHRGHLHSRFVKIHLDRCPDCDKEIPKELKLVYFKELLNPSHSSKTVTYYI